MHTYHIPAMAESLEHHPAADACPSPLPPPPFKTLAFLDLETTGLPSEEFNKTKITQLSIVACSLEHLQELGKNDIPRVTHKLSLCFNPYKMIRMQASAVTGLTNELLEHERKFDANAADLICRFFAHLQQPVLLVAHNGFRFDYPIFKKHFVALDKSLPDSTTLCCDSLEIFRKIDEIYEENSKTLINGYKLTSWERMKDATVAMIDSEILGIEAFLENCDNDCEEGEEALSQLEQKFISHVPKKEHDDDDDDEIKDRQLLNETTPNKPVQQAHKMPPSKAGGAVKRPLNSSVSRELFPNGASTSKSGFKKWPKGKYKLCEIYRRFFGELPPNSHDAEGDVIALMKCVIACRKEFIEVAQTMSKNFCDVKEL
jgi:three prime repair exonuclease-1